MTEESGVPAYAYIDGAFVAWKEANVHVSTHALHYGTGCYEGIKSYWNAPKNQLYIFRGIDHYRRLRNSCKLLFINVELSAEELLEISKELLQKNKAHSDCYIRPVAYKKAHPKIIGAELLNVTDGLFILTLPMKQYHSKEVLHLGSSSWRRVKDVVIPPRGKINGLYVNNSLARSEAMLNGYDDALILTEEGLVSEGATSNIVMVRNGTLITPPPYMDILEGITLDTVIQIAKHLGTPMEFRPINRSELYIADEVFLCGTASEVKAVNKLDHRIIGDGKVGPITRRIQEVFGRILLGEEKSFGDWLQPVY